MKSLLVRKINSYFAIGIILISGVGAASILVHLANTQADEALARTTQFSEFERTLLAP